MARLARRERGEMPVTVQFGGAPQLVRRQTQILLHRLQQGCYGICAGSFLAIPAAILGEHTPSPRTMAVLAGAGLFAGAVGMLIEMIESRSSAGGTDER